jgi:hypothetical protein
MATCPTDNAQYIEEIKTIVFRGDDGITIPKIVREQAYELSIDVIIRSIPKESYLNYEVAPPESFYGNATIIFQDCVAKKIPLKFPRQRIYYGRVSEAFEQWNELINFEYARAYFLAVGESLASLGSALGAGVIPALFCCSLPEPRWRELPIREAFFSVPYGTQYEVEISWLRPVAFSDSCDTFYTGNSQQEDGDKDDGLPSEGSFPNIADDPENPYRDLPPMTPDSEQLGFSNSKISNIDDPDPDNAPNDPYAGQSVPENAVYWLKLTSITSRPNYSGGCSGLKRYEVTVFPLIDNTVRVEGLRTTTSNVVNAGCGDVPDGGWQMQLTGGDFFLVGNSDQAPTYEYKVGSTITDSDALYFA